MSDATGRTVEKLVADLASQDATARQHARAALEKIGTATVPSLLQALGAPQQHMRWEAAKALAQIRDPSAADRLIGALGDKNSDVRWVVGEALIALRAAAAKPLLVALTKSELSDEFYRAAHHVLHELAGFGDLAPKLAPVIQAIDQPEPEMAVPLAAAEALKDFTV